MLITFEGTDFAGKTTQINRLYNNIKVPVIKTREPGGTPIAEKIREILKNDNSLSIETQLKLFQAARHDHIEKIIYPNRDKIILCDRYIFSSYAYQYDALSDNGWEDYFREIRRLDAWPSATLFFKSSYETFLKRSRDIKKDILENVSQEIFNERQNLFDNIAAYDKLYDSAVIETDKLSEDEVEIVVKHYIRKWIDVDC